MSNTSVKSDHDHRFISIPNQSYLSADVPDHVTTTHTSVTQTLVSPKGDGMMTSFSHTHKPVELLSAPVIVCVCDEGTYISISVVGRGTASLTVYELPHHADSSDALSLLLTPGEKMNLKETHVLSKKTIGLFKRNIVFLVADLRPFCNYCAVAHTVTEESDQDSTHDPSLILSLGPGFDPPLFYLQFFTPPLSGKYLNSTVIAPICINKDREVVRRRTQIKNHSHGDGKQLTDIIRSREIQTLESHSVKASRTLTDKLLNIKSLLCTSVRTGTMSVHVQNVLNDAERGWGSFVGVCGGFLVSNIRNSNIDIMSDSVSEEYHGSNRYISDHSSRAVRYSLHSIQNPNTMHRINITDPQRSSSSLQGGLKYARDGPYGCLSSPHYYGDDYLESMATFIGEMDATEERSVQFLTVYVSHPLIPHMKRNIPPFSKTSVKGRKRKDMKDFLYDRWTSNQFQSHLLKCDTLTAAARRGHP